MADATLDLRRGPDASFPRATSLVIHMRSQTDLTESVIIALQSNKCSRDLTSGAQLVCNCEYFNGSLCVCVCCRMLGSVQTQRLVCGMRNPGAQRSLAGM